VPQSPLCGRKDAIMAFSFIPTRSARYLVVVRESNGDTFNLWCDSITDVRGRLTHNLSLWGKLVRESVAFRGEPIRVLCTCGNTPANLPAEAVKAATLRCGRYTVAMRGDWRRATYLEVISLK